MNRFPKTFKTIILMTLTILYGCSDQENEIQLVKRGKTEYVIYLDPSAPESVKSAAEDLKEYFKKVAKCSFEIVLSSQIPAAPYISLGNTTASKLAGLDASNIPIDGYHILTQKGNLYILGPDTPDGEINRKGGVNKGTSNGVYTFIEDYLGVKWLMPGEIGEEYNEIRALKIPAISRTEYSPFDYRYLSYRNKGDHEDKWDRRMKLDQVTPIEHNHNWVKTVPPSLFKQHPEWFAMANGKRIPPASDRYMLETTNQELVKYFAGKIIEAFKKDPLRRWYSLSASDGTAYSESPESMALTEIDPHGNISYMPAVLKFYNDIAKIVRKEFPDHMLGGYTHQLYRYPPSTGFEIEPNIALMIPNGLTYGFRFYRPDARETWASYIWIPEWSELSKKHGFDIYYYNLPISLIHPNGIITPPAPDILNFQFSGIVKYGFKGAQIYGNPNWPVSGPGNYAIAKLFWDPNQDAHKILKDYYQAAYGPQAGNYIEQLFAILDTAYSNCYNQKSTCWFTLSKNHLTDIYAPYYEAMEQLYLKALSSRKNPRQQKRLELFGQVLSLLQWHLRDNGLITEDYKSSLTLTIEEIDKLLANQINECRITRQIDFRPEKIKVEKLPPLPSFAIQEKTSLVPMHNRGGNVILIHPLTNGEVTIKIEAFNKRAEFIYCFLTDQEGKELFTGVVFEGRTIRFNGNSGSNYFLKFTGDQVAGKLKASNASLAYFVPSTGLRLSGNLMDGTLPLYFYVPKEITSFNIILNGKGTEADVYNPDGKVIGNLKNAETSVAKSKHPTLDAINLIISKKDVKEGFWKISLKKFSGYCDLPLDEQLPQWFIVDPANPLKISPIK